ncbi:MAG TPA: dihydrolipoamide acetyltransferase family protein [Solirubrobacteraceae bacterium]
MSSEIVMPRLSDTMEEGTILRWLKQDGETVQRGEELVEIETDKATMVYESDVAGALSLIAAEGDTLSVGTPIARVGETSGNSSGSTAEQPAPVAAQVAEAPAGSAGAETDGARGGEGGKEEGEEEEGEEGRGGEEGERRVKASPLARRIARREGIDLAGVAGTGPGGRIVRADVSGETAVTAGAATPPPGENAEPVPASAEPEAGAEPRAGEGGEPVPASAEPEAVARAKGATTEVELTRLQQAVARRMAESKATIPDFTLAIDVDMEDCVALRAQLKRVAVEGAAPPPTYNDMVVKACALALREHPQANGSYRDGKLQLHSRINVGVAVAAEGALVVPTVFDADSKALGEIAREARALAERVRAATITPPELGGGTFTVSNLGMFGIRSFTAIINPPQAAIMSVGALERRAVAAEDGSIAARQMLTLTLVCDHRILYGAEAARFLARVRELLQTPAALTL